MPMLLLRLLVLSLICNLSIADTSLWRVSDGKHTLYLGGTIHLLRPQDYPLPAEFDQALAMADELILEVVMSDADLGAFQSKLSREGFYKGPGLQDHLEQSTWQQLEVFCDARGLPPETLSQLKPALLMLTLFDVERRRLGINAQGVDSWYENQAIAANKPVYGLETAEQQLDFILAMGVGNEDAFVQQTIKDLNEMGPLIDEMIAAWRTGETEEIEHMLVRDMRDAFPEIYQQLIVQRNNNWLPDIERMLDTPETELILVGLAHLIGPDGLLPKLEQAGYELKRYQIQ